MANDLEIAIEAARAGARIVAAGFGRANRVDLKRKFDPVTEVDKAAEKTIVTILREHRPGYGILAEEGSGSAVTGMRWIVDPLDGTVNYVHSIPQIGVSIALFDGAEPLVAVTIDALRDEEFIAEAGGGATLNGERLQVSAVPKLARAVVATGFPYDHDVRAAELVRILGRVLPRINGLRRLGSAVLDMAWVAAGRFDAYWESGLAPWDMAAGILLVREAGGRVTNMAGDPLVPEAEVVVASNGRLHEELRSLVAGETP